MARGLAIKLHSLGVKIAKLVTGGQTGVDRAALDAALELGVPAGGWCPKGRWAEDGTIDPRYPLKETPSADVAQRTEWNARDSDATLILCEGAPVGGTDLTAVMAARYGKPCLIVDLAADGDLESAASRVEAWAAAGRYAVLNVAGPRESTTPGIYQKSLSLLRRILR